MISFGLLRERHALDLVVVDALALAVDAVGHDVEVAAGVGEAMAVGEVAAAGEVHPHQLVARPEQARSRRPCWRDVPLWGWTLTCSAPKSCLRAVDGEALGHVHELAAAVVALAGIALGVLVGEDAARRLQHGAADEVFRSDQLEAEVLARALVGDGLIDVRVDGFQRAVVRHQAVSPGSPGPPPSSDPPSGSTGLGVTFLAVAFLAAGFFFSVSPVPRMRRAPRARRPRGRSRLRPAAS